MDEEKFTKSKAKFIATFQNQVQQKRKTLPLPTDITERPIAGGKRMRLEGPSCSQAIRQKQAGMALQHKRISPMIHTPIAAKTDTEYLIYPPRAGGVSIYTSDIERLAERQWMNDRLVNLMMCWAYERYIPEGKQDQVQLCNSFIYTTFTRNIRAREVQMGDEQLLTNFERVNQYRKTPGPGKKPITLLPICEENHWYLVVVINETMEDDNKVKIWIIDSLKTHTRTHAAQVIKWYLEHTRQKQIYAVIDTLEVHQQTNLFDCGVYLTHNIRRLLHFLGHCSTTDLDEVTQFLNEGPLTTRADIKNLIDCLKNNAEVQFSSPVPNSEQHYQGKYGEDNQEADEDPNTATITFEIPSEHGIALDGQTMLINASSETWKLDEAELQEVSQVAKTARDDLISKNKKCLRFLRTNTGNAILYSFRRSFGRVIRKNTIIPSL